jgi:hypothetical protein
MRYGIDAGGYAQVREVHFDGGKHELSEFAAFAVVNLVAEVHLYAKLPVSPITDHVRADSILPNFRRDAVEAHNSLFG